ncbi:Bromo domain-containing protein [Caenorhabditis elegans]|uniref:Bromo domain-containing protein n=1 Tax=Caenorhabditis elegans TaxID=6239 RepID=A0A8S4Q965_CAEEL|nr:Bromo domain-containing protein [Caenorhabditis elegans]CAH2122121.1 Bromo domain-containing protein [Caenorhabditis elegans]
MNNTHHHTNGYRTEKPKNEEDLEDPYANLSDFYKNHPAARNEACSSASNGGSKSVKMEPKVEKNEEFEEYIGDPVRLEDMEPFARPSLRDDAPLSSILHPDLDGIDPRIFFKDFNPNKTLRFSRLFAQNIKHTSRAEIWWASRTFSKHQRKKEPEEPLADDVIVGAKKLKLNIIEKVPRVMLADDEEERMRRPILTDAEEMAKKNEEGTVVQPWRTGPAKIWYDMMNLPMTSQAVNYGFKLKKSPQKVSIRSGKPLNYRTPDDLPSTSSGPAPNSAPFLDKVEVIDKSCEASTSEDILLPYQVIEWENDVILDGEEVKDQLLEEFSNGRGCGWIPTQYTRTYEHFVYAANNNAFEQMFDGKSAPINLTGPDSAILPTPGHSIFPSAPCDLDILPWETNIIWDADAMPSTLEPIDFLVDFQDDPLIYGMPEDRRHDEGPDHHHHHHHHRKDGQYTKKSKMILGQVQQRQKQEEDEQMESTMAQFTDNDPFNLSNDDYYVPKATSKTLSNNSLLIQHSTPATNIATHFFPTHPSAFRLRYWHRTPFTRRIVRHWQPMRFQPIQTPVKHQQRVAAMREAMRQAQGGGEVFYMRDVQDLSGKDETLVMIEYSEEHPVILSQPGMASKMKNYFKRRQANDSEPTFTFGELAFSHQIPFLGQLQPGQSLQSIENMLYRAPIYLHKRQNTDFLLIRSMNQWYIRPLPSIFVAGQQCPLYEVPSPNSKRATVFVRDFLFAFIYRLFWASDSSPRRLKMDDVRNAFPHYAESNIRKRLKMCSTFVRQGSETYWSLKPDFRLPSKEEVLSMVTPEMCCAQYSMMAAEQRLKDAGYGEKYFFTPENDEGSEDEVTIEDEIKCAPWNTTRAFLASQREKCLLDQTGIADPTGCGQGFSYVRVSQKPHKDENATPVPKKLVTGTNADLRKLPLKEAKQICRGYGVKEEEISALTRWEIIDVIRTLSTQAAKATKDGETVSGMARFARGNTRFSSADMQEKYRKHCQRIFDQQNQTLANTDPISTDDDSTDADSDNEELASRLESMLEANKGKKNISMSEKAKIDFETEEKEREDLKRMIHGTTNQVEKGEKKEEGEVTAEEKKSASQFGEDVAMSASKISGITANQQLKIYRTCKGPDGKDVTRIEIVTRPQLIEAYTRIRMTRDDTFIQVYAQMDEQYKEEKRKKKRRLQDQIRRMKKNEEKAAHKVQKMTEKKVKPIKPPNPNLQKMRCSACHAYGHMKTNRNCPLYGKDPLTPLKEEDEGSTIMTSVSSASLVAPDAVQVDGTKVKFNLNFAEIRKEQNREEKLKRKLAKMAEAAVRERQMAHLMEYGGGASSSGGAGGGGSGIGGSTGGGITDNDDDDRFSQISGTSSFLNGPPGAIRGGNRNSSVSGSKRRSSMMPEEDYLQGPLKVAHRARADPKVVMSSMLTDIVNELKMISGSDAFVTPVNSKKVVDYYNIIKNPISLQEIKKKISEQSYLLRKDFLDDIKLMFDNSRMYNGDNNILTLTAQQMLQLAGKRMIEREQKFIGLEKQINPLLDTNDLIGFSYLLGEIVQKMKNIPKSALFHTRVDPKKIPAYYLKISDPMDLSIMEQKSKSQEYKSIDEFLKDAEKIYTNSVVFNGAESVYSLKAKEMFEMAEMLVKDQMDTLGELERNINPSAINDAAAAQRGLAMDSDDHMDEMEDHPTEEEEEDDDDEIMDDDMDIDATGYSYDHDDNVAVGQIFNDLAMSDSDEDERAEDVKRPANGDDNLLDSF